MVPARDGRPTRELGDDVTDNPADDQLAGDLPSAIERLHEQHAVRLGQYIKWVTCGLLQPQDLADVYQETLLALLEKVRKPSFRLRRHPADLALLSLAYKIAHHKGINVLRRRQQGRIQGAAILPGLPADSRESDFGFAVKQRLGPAEAREFRRVLFDILQTLPERQRLVARVFMEHYEDFRQRDTYQQLAQKVSEVTGRPESEAAVKSAWRAARDKIRAELRRRSLD
jgi:RNA polymerase sigma factor (sigma-70 family)